MKAIWTMMAALAAAAVPAAASAEGWRHERSGVGVPDLPSGLRTGAVTDNRRDGSDVYVQFGGGNEPVTLYVYRSAFPNPALWFERTRMAMNMHVGSGNESAAPRIFTLGDSAAPNGLREEVALPPGGNFRATAVAIAQYGEWIVKARITSASLDRAGVARRMDELLAAIRLPSAVPAPLPLAVPTPCTDENGMRGRPRAQGGDAARLAASALALAHEHARGRGGLAANPTAWCRERTAFPTQYGTIYRQRDGRAWTALIGDSGLAVSAHPVDVPDADGAATFAVTSSMTGLAQLYDHMPAPEAAIGAALPILVGRAAPRARIDANSGDRR